MYIGMPSAGPHPLYWDFMLEAKEKVEKGGVEVGHPWRSSDYIPAARVAPWRGVLRRRPRLRHLPRVLHQRLNTDTWTVQNAWLNEVNEGGRHHLMSTATAAAKGARERRLTVRLTSDARPPWRAASW